MRFDLPEITVCLYSLLLLVPANDQERTAGLRSRDPRIPYLPTPQEVVEKMLELAAPGKNDVVFDLGCGDGLLGQSRVRFP